MTESIGLNGLEDEEALQEQIAFIIADLKKVSRISFNYVQKTKYSWIQARFA